MTAAWTRLGPFELVPSWGLGRDEWYGSEGGGAIVMHPLALAQVRAELAGVERGRPDLDVWLEEMVSAVSRRAAARAAVFEIEMRSDSTRLAMRDPSGLVAAAVAVSGAATAAVGTASRIVATIESVADAYREALETMSASVVESVASEMREGWVVRAAEAVLHAVRGVAYRLGARPRPGSVLYSPSRDYVEQVARLNRIWREGLEAGIARRSGS